MHIKNAVILLPSRLEQVIAVMPQLQHLFTARCGACNPLQRQLRTRNAAPRRESASVGAELRGGRDAVVQQPRTVLRVRPGACHDGGANKVAPKALETLNACCDLGCCNNIFGSGDLSRDEREGSGIRAWSL